MQVVRIFTDKSISPSLSLRQYPNHYTIRAGRNLPDKEFRYLRTVIVTAAVYWGFISDLHRYYNFTELMAETVPRSLHHSCRSEEGGPILRQLLVGGTGQGVATVYQKHRTLLSRLQDDV